MTVAGLHVGFLLSCAGLVGLFLPGEVRGDVGASALLSARCKALCLGEFNARSSHLPGGVTQIARRGTDFLEDCLKDSVCTACVRPCNYTDIGTRKATCNTYCQAGEDSCARTCVFLKSGHTKKPGSCKAPEAATGFEAACIDSCTKDGDCADNLKCCSNGPDCGFTCQLPDKLAQDIPKTPNLGNTTEKRDGRAVMVTWHSKETTNDSATHPVVIYVLQRRHMLVVKPKWGLNTPWEVVTQTTRRNYLVRDVQAGHWYQFRVAAVVTNGTRGFSLPTAAFRSSREVQAPTPPRNLTESGFTVQDGKINLNVTWLPPLSSDLPVIKYKVYWSARLSQIAPQMVSLYVHKVNVQNRTWTVIKGLLSDTTYFIEAEAIARKGDFRMKSLRVSNLITTYKIPLPETPEPPTPESKGLAPPNYVTVNNITTETPFFQRSEIKCLVMWDVKEEDKMSITKYMITWKPISCGFRGDENILADLPPTGATSHSRSFYTYGLQFGCHYVLRIRVVNVKGVQGPVTEATFFVPQCPDILVKSSQKPECPTLAEPLPPLRPRQLQHSVYVGGKNISVVVKWKLPHSDAQIDSFKVTWGVIGHRSIHDDRTRSMKKDLSEMDKASLKSLQLLGDAHRAVLETLTPDSVYAVEVVAKSAAGESPPASLQFNTPSQPPPDRPDLTHVETADQPRPHDVDISVKESQSKAQSSDIKASYPTPSPPTSTNHAPSSAAGVTLLISVIVMATIGL